VHCLWSVLYVTMPCVDEKFAPSTLVASGQASVGGIASFNCILAIMTQRESNELHRPVITLSATHQSIDHRQFVPYSVVGRERSGQVLHHCRFSSLEHVCLFVMSCDRLTLEVIDLRSFVLICQSLHLVCYFGRFEHLLKAHLFNLGNYLY